MAPEKQAYTQEELAEFLKQDGRKFVQDDTPIPMTQDGTLPTAQVDSVDAAPVVHIEAVERPADPAQAANNGHVDSHDLGNKTDGAKVASEIDQTLHPQKYDEVGH